MNHYGVILAGGGGERFWPLSRENNPKQFMNLTGKDVLVNEAIDRVATVIPEERIFIVTSETQAAMMADVASAKIPSSNIIAEPAPRNTAACIGLAAVTLLRKYGDGVMVVTPSDHCVGDVPALTGALQTAIRSAEDTDQLVTIGLKPTFPATVYGYIKTGKPPKIGTVQPVLRFHEKPDRETAERYLSGGGYLWNSGMFIWKASVILDQLRRWAADIYDAVIKIGDAIHTPQETEVLQRVYPDIRKISVDYAVMEPAAANGEAVVIPADCQWHDIGSWDMMRVLHDPDENGNVLLGDTVTVDTKNTVVYASGRTVAAAGVDGLIIVETPDAVMVCRKDNAQDVKWIVEKLKAQGRKELL